MDNSRQQTAMIKIGVIEAVDIQKAKARVKFEDLDGLSSDWLPIIFLKTLKDQCYAMPDLGEHVICLLDENFETGVILGAIYDAQNLPNNPSEDIDYIQYDNGTEIKVDHSTGDIEVTTPGNVVVKSEQRVTIEAASVLVDAPQVRMTGHLAVANGISSEKTGQGMVSAGDIIAQNISLVNHVHGGVESGGSTTSTPVAG